MGNFLTEHWELFTGAIGSIIAFFGGRKIKKAEEKKSTSEALEAMQKTYDTFVQDFKERYNEVKEDLKQYREEQLLLKNEINQLRQENNELRKELKEWEQKYTRLKKEFDKYKLEN